MTEFINLLGKTGIRFTGSPVTISPQLEDYGIQNILRPLSTERNVKFRVVLYVPTLEQNELRIVFPTDDTMEVCMEHEERKMPKKQQVSWSRDCRYLFKLPEGVKKSCLTAVWTHDSFLLIQARSQRPGSVSNDKEDCVDQIFPSKVCAVLRPHLDLGIIRNMMWLHQTEVDEICNYLETRGTVPENMDVLKMFKSGSSEQCREVQVTECLDKKIVTQGNQELNGNVKVEDKTVVQESEKTKEELREEYEGKPILDVNKGNDYTDEPMESMEENDQKLKVESETIEAEEKLELVSENGKDVMETDVIE